jgi:hypothetical protein
VTDPALPARLIQLVARFRPDADGVGETALRLADVFWKDDSLPSDFLVFKPPQPEPALEIPAHFAHTVERLNGAGKDALAHALDRLAAASRRPPVLLLHYASYGYSPNGTPFWLAAAMERFVRRGGRLLTLFHELYALPRFPSRTFFTSHLQRRVFRRLLAASEAAFTSNEDFLETAQRDNRAGRPIRLIGICSSAGEPESPRPLVRRKRRIAVFGRFATRRQLYALHLQALERVARHLDIEEIADMGAVDDPQWMEQHVLGRLGPLVHVYGSLPVEEASRLLEDSVAGALAYSYALRGKSSVFAAYQAHAAAILLFPEREPGFPAEILAEMRAPASWTLSAEEILELPVTLSALPARLQQAASAGHKHYRTHRSAHAMAGIVLPALRTAGSPR